MVHLVGLQTYYEKDFECFCWVGLLIFQYASWLIAIIPACLFIYCQMYRKIHNFAILWVLAWLFYSLQNILIFKHWKVSFLYSFSKAVLQLSIILFLVLSLQTKRKTSYKQDCRGNSYTELVWKWKNLICEIKGTVSIDFWP